MLNKSSNVREGYKYMSMCAISENMCANVHMCLFSARGILDCLQPALLAEVSVSIKRSPYLHILITNSVLDEGD